MVFELGSGSLYIANVGKKICDLNGIPEVKLETNTRYEPRYDGIKKYPKDGEISFNVKNDKLDIDRLFGVDTSNFPDAYDISFVKVFQKRKHKKKRINKKWKKRYGYETKTVEAKGYKIKSCVDGSFEFKKDIQ